MTPVADSAMCATENNSFSGICFLCYRAVIENNFQPICWIHEMINSATGVTNCGRVNKLVAYIFECFIVVSDKPYSLDNGHIVDPCTTTVARGGDFRQLWLTHGFTVL